ncbi:terpene synthase family protein [Streptomyces sp. YS-3]|uniref:terpene synthase family protein n=1 Tax=Streptomyces sp. YS-3 TaxID=3381352 RepID=UPI00386280E3
MSVRFPDGFLTFWIPMEPMVAPNAQSLITECTTWARKAGLGGGNDTAAAIYANVGALLVAHCFPTTTGPLQQALADYSAWAFEINDVVVPAPESSRTTDTVHITNRCVRLGRSPHSWGPDASPLEKALADALIRIRAHTSDVHYERFVRPQEAWCHAMLWETALRERHTPPGVNEYLAMRGSASGLYATMGIIPAAGDIGAADWELAAPAVQAAAEAGLLAAVMDNDRYSYLKEVVLGQDKYTLQTALRTDHPDMSRDDALSAAVGIRDAMMALYLRLRDQILTCASEQLRRYFACIDRVIAGNFRFGATAMRYLDPAATHTYQRTTTPPSGIKTEEALPYPTIAWWWDHLT